MVIVSQDTTTTDLHNFATRAHQLMDPVVARVTERETSSKSTQGQRGSGLLAKSLVSKEIWSDTGTPVIA